MDLKQEVDTTKIQPAASVAKLAYGKMVFTLALAVTILHLYMLYKAESSGGEPWEDFLVLIFLYQGAIPGLIIVILGLLAPGVKKINKIGLLILALLALILWGSCLLVRNCLSSTTPDFFPSQFLPI